MGLEVATYISNLVSTNPLSGDDASQGDDHLRLIKAVLQSSFPNMDGPFYRPKQTTKTTNYTLAATDDNQTIILDSASALTITLPPTSGGGAISAGWSCQLVVKQTASGAHSLTRNATPGTDTINGSAGVTPLQNIGDSCEVHFIGSGTFLVLSRAWNYSTVRLNPSNDFIGARWMELAYSASSHTVPSTNIGLGSALLGSDYFLRTKDNAGNMRYVRRPTVTVFLADGTWTKPDGCTSIDVVCIGGGGAGGGCDATAAGESSFGAGGGGGAASYEFRNTSFSNTETVTIGTAGAGSSGASGGAGGATSFGTLCVAAGGNGGGAGAGGTAVARLVGGAGGAAASGTGDVKVSGGPGHPGFRLAATTPLSGAGGSAGNGGGGGVATTGSAAGTAAAANTGGGGGGAANLASQSARAGGNGGTGLVVVTEYYD